MKYYYKNEIARDNENNIQLCNICNSELNIRHGYKKNTILSCKNEKCLSYIKPYTNKWKSFYDLVFYNRKMEKYLKNRLTPLQKEYWINKGYCEKDAINKISKLQSEYSKKNTKRISILQKEYWINKGYSEEESKKKITEIQKKRSPLSVDYWIKKGLSEEEAIKKISTIQKKNTKNIDYLNRNHPQKLSYWLNIVVDEDIANKLHKDFCKIKYSLREDKIGLDKYTNMMKKRHDTYYKKTEKERKKINKSRGRTFEQLKKEKGIEYALDLMKKRTFKYKNYSNISQELFNSLIRDNGEYYYGDNEWVISHDKGIFYVDFKYEDKIIEFNGSVFHADKRFYNADDTPNPFNKVLKAKEIWHYDEKRLNIINRKNYNIKIVWEYDYLNDKEKVINECKEFLYEENNKYKENR